MKSIVHIYSGSLDRFHRQNQKQLLCGHTGKDGQTESAWSVNIEHHEGYIGSYSAMSLCTRCVELVPMARLAETPL